MYYCHLSVYYRYFVLFYSLFLLFLIKYLRGFARQALVSASCFHKRLMLIICFPKNCLKIIPDTSICDQELQNTMKVTNSEGKYGPH